VLPVLTPEVRAKYVDARDYVLLWSLEDPVSFLKNYQPLIPGTFVPLSVMSECH